MRRLVLDTNVFLSGIFWSGPPAKILDAWQSNKIKLIFSPAILEEYVRVGNLLAKKYSGVMITPFIDLLIKQGEAFNPISLKTPISRDQDDDKFIATALAAKCHLIITGDQDLLVLKEFCGIRIIKPAVFVKEML